jgi:hypothetical protein
MLNACLRKKKASLIMVRGRRRIGKSPRNPIPSGVGQAGSFFKTTQAFCKSFAAWAVK